MKVISLRISGPTGVFCICLFNWVPEVMSVPVMGFSLKPKLVGVGMRREQTSSYFHSASSNCNAILLDTGTKDVLYIEKGDKKKEKKKKHFELHKYVGTR